MDIWLPSARVAVKARGASWEWSAALGSLHVGDFCLFVDCVSKCWVAVRCCSKGCCD